MPARLACAPRKLNWCRFRSPATGIHRLRRRCGTGLVLRFPSSNLAPSRLSFVAASRIGLVARCIVRFIGDTYRSWSARRGGRMWYCTIRYLPRCFLVGELGVVRMHRNLACAEPPAEDGQVASRQCGASVPVRGIWPAARQIAACLWRRHSPGHSSDAVHRLRRRNAGRRQLARAPDRMHRSMGPCPRHVVDLRGGTKILGRIAMAVQAPLHLQRVLLIHQRHLVHAAMTAGAANALVHMDRVIEVHIIRQIMHLDPEDRLARRPAIAHRSQQVGIRPDLRVTVDTGLGRGNARVARFLHRRVTVLALQAQTLYVVLVAERNRLVRALPLAGDPRASAAGSSAATPSAITINPERTRLIRASELELRSKICAMNANPYFIAWLRGRCKGYPARPVTMIGYCTTFFLDRTSEYISRFFAGNTHHPKS